MWHVNYIINWLYSKAPPSNRLKSFVKYLWGMIWARCFYIVFFSFQSENNFVKLWGGNHHPYFTGEYTERFSNLFLETEVLEL